MFHLKTIIGQIVTSTHTLQNWEHLALVSSAYGPENGVWVRRIALKPIHCELVYELPHMEAVKREAEALLAGRVAGMDG